MQTVAYTMRVGQIWTATDINTASQRNRGSSVVVGERHKGAEMRRMTKFLAGALLVSASAAGAQEAVMPAENPDILFTSPDPVLNANKQVVYNLCKYLLGAGRWDMADKFITERYIQHNPNIPSGRAAIVAFGKSFAGTPRPVSEHLQVPVVAVLAEGDLVTVITRAELPDPRSPGKTYTTAWFDMWRIKDGKADEHWDGATLMPPPPAPAPVKGN